MNEEAKVPVPGEVNSSPVVSVPSYEIGPYRGREDVAKLATKLARIVKKVGYTQKTGFNKDQGYKYASESDLLQATREAISEENVFILVRPLEWSRTDAHPTRSGTKQYFGDVRIQFDIIDGETGYRESVIFPGVGIDFADKELYKAITGAQKYFLSKTFMVPTGDDPEKDESAEGNQGSSTTPPPQAKKPAPPVNNKPAEGKEEPRPGEKKSLEQATAEAIAEGDKKREEKKAEKKGGATDPLPTKEELNGFLDRLKPYQDKLGGAGSEGSKKLKTFILKAAGEVETTKQVTAKHWNTVLTILESAKDAEALKKLVGV